MRILAICPLCEKPYFVYLFSIENQSLCSECRTNKTLLTDTTNDNHKNTNNHIRIS